MSECKSIQRRLQNSEEKLFTRKQNFRTDLYKLGKFETSSPRVSVYIRNFHYHDARVNKMPHEKLRKNMSTEKYISTKDFEDAYVSVQKI